MLIGIEKKPYYLNNEIFGYFSKKNTLDYHLKICEFKVEKLKEFEKNLKSTRIGTQFKFDKWASQNYLKVELAPWELNGREINQSFTYHVATKPLHSDIIEKSDKMSYMVRMDPKPEVDPENGE